MIGLGSTDGIARMRATGIGQGRTRFRSSKSLPIGRVAGFALINGIAVELLLEARPHGIRYLLFSGAMPSDSLEMRKARLRPVFLSCRYLLHFSRFVRASVRRFPANS
jgi:hypothetical protein